MKKSWIYSAFMALILLTPAASHGKIDQQIEDMLSAGQHFAIYDDRDFGKSLVSIGYSRNSNPDIAIDMAKQDATKALGSFLRGEKVNATEVAEQRFDGDRVDQSYYHQMITSVEASLRSAYLYQSGQYRDKTYAVVIISETGSHAASNVDGAPTSNVVSARGFASVKDGRTKARETALNQALRSAVEQYSGVRIVAKTSIENADSYMAKLASVSKGYVKSYQIVREHQDGNNYVVEISATISEEDPNGNTNIDAIKQSLSNSAFYLDFKHTRLKDMIAEILTNNNLDITHTKGRAGYVLTGTSKVANMMSPCQKR